MLKDSPLTSRELNRAAALIFFSKKCRVVTVLLGHTLSLENQTKEIPEQMFLFFTGNIRTLKHQCGVLNFDLSDLTLLDDTCIQTDIIVNF